MLWEYFWDSWSTKLPWINSSSEPALTDDSLIITRSVLILRRTSVYLKILLIKKCETDASRWRIMIDRAQIICPRIKHIESDECPWSWAPGCHWSSFIASAKLNSIPRHALVCGLVASGRVH
ncbi:unnamed protein product [Gongylonema pulchrum]|uniref:Uncharacterized protein n=1 Tax=Gongylonema pulchrum TaxID=637853 RepID=A0A183DXA8_9BILA|nr:unnamed protein product [Gongylonema pulchrum]